MKLSGLKKLWFVVGIVFVSVGFYGFASQEAVLSSQIFRRVKPHLVRLAGMDEPVAVEELAVELAKIDKPYFVFDLDRTLLPKDTDLSKEENYQKYKATLEMLALVLQKAKEDKTKVAIISANSRAYITSHLLKPFQRYLNEELNDLELLNYLAVYVDGGGLKLTFDENGEPLEPVKNAEAEKIENYKNTIANLIGKILTEVGKNLSPEERKAWKAWYIGELKRKYPDWEDKTKYPDFQGYENINLDWIDGEDFVPEVVDLEADEVGPRLIAPWLELRDGVQLGIKPVKEMVDEKGKASISFRSFIIKELLNEPVLKELVSKSIRPGGTGTIDISMIFKSDVLEEIIEANGLQNQRYRVVYLGDEFGKDPKTNITGHDFFIAERVKGINIISVDTTQPAQDIKDKVVWIGGGPEATLKLLSFVISVLVEQ